MEFYGPASSKAVAVVDDRPAMAVFGTGNVSVTIGGRVEPVLQDSSGHLVRVVGSLTGVTP